MSRAFVTIRVQGRSQRFTLSEGELATIGRSATCALRVRDKSVSREHCVAILTAGKIRISDLASTHGVMHGGKRVDQCELLPGDSCHLGGAYFVFDRVSDPDGPNDEAAPAPPRGAGVSGPEASSEDRPIETSAETPDAPPAEIAGYRILEFLGSGGFGVVYRAQQVRLGREVALKILRPSSEAAGADANVEAFMREARAAASVNDPRLVQIFDVGQDRGVHFLSMELVSGGSLARRLKRHGPMAWREGLSLIRDVALALQAAHQSKLVHRDVKPANILLTSEGQAKLTDLGLASGAVDAGTVAFMAPEQILRREVDERADIYALGCTAYAALTGRPPFAGSKDEIARAHLRQLPESFQRLGIQVPWHLDQLIVDSMMAKDPADRPRTATELLERLDQLILPGTELRARAPRGSQRAPGKKALAARLLSELIVFTLVAAIVLAALLALKYRWPDLDIYRLIGK